MSLTELELKNYEESMPTLLQAAIINSGALTIFVVDENLCITFGNQAAEKEFGYIAAELIGKPLNLLIPGSSECLHQKRTDCCSDVQEDTKIRHLQVQAKRKDGTEFPAEITVLEILHAKQVSYAVILQDISTYKRAEEARLNSLVLLYQMTNNSINKILDFGLEETIKLTESAIGYIYFYSEETRQFTLYSWSKTVMDQCAILEKKTVYDLDKTGLWGEVVRQRKPIITNNYSAPNSYKKGLPEGHVPVLRHMNVPVFHNDEIVAIVGVGNKESIYTEDDVRQLRLFADALWNIITRKKAEEVLRENMERYRSTLDNMLEGCQIIGFDWRYLYMNDAAAKHGRRSKEELLGRTMMEIYPGIENTNMFSALRCCMDGRAPSHIENEFVFPDGSTGWFELSIQPVPEGVFILSFEITEHKRAEKQNKRQLGHLAALRQIDLAIVASTDLHLTLNTLLDTVVAQLKVDAASIQLLNPHTQMLEFAASRGFRTRGIERSQLRLGEGHSGRAALERRIVQIANLAEAKDEFRHAHMLEGEGFVSFNTIPLIAKGQVKGVLEIFHRTQLEADEEWMNFLESLAGQAAIAIDNATLFEDLHRANIDLTLAYDATIEGWSHALDLRDKETEGHTQRVTEMTVTLARAVGVSDAEIVHMRRGALLHDIGKMGIPDAILLKPAPLTDDEWIIMRKHPQYAFDMLSSIDFLRLALDIPYCHHEKWDGTGYPRGLKNKQIPLAARIFAFADVWDALRSDRPYREAWSEGKIIEHIRSLSGSHFDPEITKVFLREIESVSSLYDVVKIPLS